MKPIDLGYTPKSYDYPVGPADNGKTKGKKEKPPVNYPSLVITDKPEVHKLVNVGDVIEATVTLRVTSVTQRDPKKSDRWQDDSRIEFDVQNIEFETPEEEDQEEKEEKPDFSKLGGKGVKSDD